MMKRIFALLLVLFLLGACSRQISDTEPSSELETFSIPVLPQATDAEPSYVESSYGVGSVTIISNGVEHEPYVHYLCSASYRMIGNEKILIYADGTFLPQEKAFETLAEIQYADDFQIKIDGKDAGRSTYTFYNDKFQSVSLSGDEIENFSFPDEPGLYMLNIHTSWTHGEEYTVYAYAFKIRK